MTDTTVLDRAIGWLSPAAGLKRAQYRRAMNIALSYEAGSRSRRTRHWRRPGTDASSAIRPHITDLRAVARDLVRNNGWAARGVDVLVNNTIGTGITPHYNAASSKAATDRVEAAFKRHLDTTDIDADGRHDLYGIQRLAFRTMVESGEVLIRRRRRRPGDGFRLPFQVQVLEPDFLDHTKQGTVPRSNHLIVDGIEFDRIGRRVAYWLFDQHPGTTLRFASRRMTSKRVPAADVIHLYRADRPGQARGVTWLAPSVVKLNDFQDFDQAQLVRQQVSSCFAVFVHDINADASDVPKVGVETEDTGSGDLAERLEPGLVTSLPPGKDVSFATPPEVTGFEEYSRVSLRAIAAPLGITYEALTGDLTATNFSSGRMGWLEMARNIDVNQHVLFIPGFCRRIEQWCMEPLMVEARLPRDGVVTWGTPRREMIDPTKEVPALIKAIRAGLKTRSDCLREFGFDPVDLYDELQRDNEMADERGLVLDSDPRHTTQAGNPSAGNTQDETEQETDDDA